MEADAFNKPSAEVANMNLELVAIKRNGMSSGRNLLTGYAEDGSSYVRSTFGRSLV